MRALKLSVLLGLMASAAEAQQTVRLTGRLVDRNRGTPITAGNVRLDVGNPVNVGSDGTFRIDAPAGRRMMTVRALGYAEWQRELTVDRDTTIVVDLEPRPFTLDTVRAESRMVEAKVTIRDSATRDLVADVHVLTSIGGRKSSGHRGIVWIDVPVGERIQASFSAFGYLPVIVPFELQGDTSLTLSLQVDPVAARMIEQQITRLEDRMGGRVSAGKSTLNRQEVMQGSDAGIYTVLQREGFVCSGGRLCRAVPRLACVVIDDVETTLSPQAALQAVLPDRVERVEKLQFSGSEGRQLRMIRVYTREYIRELMLGARAPGPIVFSGNGRICK